MSRTALLRQEIEKSFVPFVQGIGFNGGRGNMHGFSEFRRASGNVIHIFDIQWDKYGRPRFVINFSTCPVSGFHINGKHFEPHAITASALSDVGRLQPGNGATTSSWFRQDHLLLKRLFTGRKLKTEGEVISQLIELFKELDTYWNFGIPGPHIRRMPYMLNAYAAKAAIN